MNYQTKTCIQTLDGHTENVTAVLFHPKLPILISGSEDGSIRIWHSVTYRYPFSPSPTQVRNDAQLRQWPGVDDRLR